ncbi:hypothetical protein [Methylobacter sp. Wu8]|uniref:hypothetical protein n=1 Tax=Methylobacter sp. Wu8 TaxID=3118457 RepID=UPI002F3587E3
MTNIEFDVDDFFSRIDFDAIEDSSNKIAECEYFLGLASAEKDRTQFRWLISAFFGAAYSFFEMSALRAYFAFTAPDTGDPIEDDEALGILRNYVDVKLNKRKPFRVDTNGKHVVTKELYEWRRENTHHFPLSIMASGSSLPEDFQFGRMKGEGIPVLAFCRGAMLLIRQVQRELDA